MMDMKLEVVVLPVVDLERAKRFYEQLGWRLDADFVTEGGPRVVQFTPPRSATLIHLAQGLTTTAPGAIQGLYVEVSDLATTRADLVRRGVAVSEIFHKRPDSDQRPGPDPQRAGHAAFATFTDPDGNTWLLQESRQPLPERNGDSRVAAETNTELTAADARSRELAEKLPGELAEKLPEELSHTLPADLSAALSQDLSDDLLDPSRAGASDKKRSHLARFLVLALALNPVLFIIALNTDLQAGRLPPRDPVPSRPSRTELQHALSSADKREIVQARTEIPTGVASGWHSHPGEEVVYVVAGRVGIEIRGRSTLHLLAGDDFLIPPGVSHNIHDLGSETSTVLSTYFVEHGRPLTTLASEE
jgi:quercetin dioxygenase-like cupin family protein/catechol 2,3-dioxygenase-like lactoylglutathione lyase family enzyme